jgi:hypothetical protein
LKVSTKRTVNSIIWRLTAEGLDQDVDAIGDTLTRAATLLALWVNGWRPYVTHGCVSEMLFEAADSLAESGVWFSGLKADYPYSVKLQRENDDSSIEVEVLTVYPERLEDGQVPPFA